MCLNLEFLIFVGRLFVTNAVLKCCIWNSSNFLTTVLQSITTTISEVNITLNVNKLDNREEKKPKTKCQ